MCAVSQLINQAWRLDPVSVWTYEEALNFKRAIKLLEDIDRRLNAKDCDETKKQQFLSELQARIDDWRLPKPD